MRKKNPKWHTEYQKQSPEQMRKAQAAKIVDCPQNAIELRKLLNTWQDIDRVKKRVLNKMDSEKYLTMLKYRELLTGETSGWLDENLLLPPGFRYHANGDDKKVRPSIRSLTVASSKTDNKSVKAKDSSLSTQSQGVSVNKKHSKNDIATDIEQEIKETEKALDEIKTDRQLHAINRKISNVKKSLTFLKAHSSNSLYDRNLKGRGPPTTRLSATKCDACFTRLKWSADNLKYQKGHRDSGNKTINRPWLPSSPSMRSTASSMGSLGSNVHSRMPSAPRNSPNITITKTPQKMTCKSVTCLDSPSRSPQNSSSDFKTLAERLKSKLGVKGSSSCSSTSVGSVEGRSPVPKTDNSRESPTGRSISTASELSVTSNTPRPRGPTPNKASITRDSLKCFTKQSHPCLETQSVQSVSLSKECRTNKTTSKKTNSKGKINAKSDDVLKIKFSEEDRYRHVMSKACISDQQKLETLSAMFEGAGLLDGGKRELDKSSHCRIRATHHSVPGIAIGRSSTENIRGNLAAARKTRLELEAKCSRDKVEDFLRRLPTPNVTIRRWRTSTGEIQMIKSTAPPVNPKEPDVTSQDAGSDAPEVDDLESAEQVDCNGSESDGRESPDSETLLMNTSLTSWPTHWAQRAVFQSRDKVNDDVIEQENGSPNSLKEFRKLSRCRYLRIPPDVLARYQSTGRRVSPQAWD